MPAEAGLRGLRMEAPPLPALAVPTGPEEEHLLPGPAPGEQTGTVVKINGTFGFIRQDSGEPDMFVMPASCVAFGGQLPLVGSRVRYTVVADEKTGRPRADGVEPTAEQAEGAPAAWAPEVGQPQLPQLPQLPQQPQFLGSPAPRPTRPGATRAPVPGGPCFFRPQAGHPASAALGGPCQPAPSRPHYAAGGAGGFAAGGQQNWGHSGAWASSPGSRPMHRGGCWQPRGGRLTGTILKISGGFGFIQQDSGEADMFVMPAACSAFASEIPPVGTRVSYITVIDGKTGRPRADAVEPASGGWMAHPMHQPMAYGPLRGGKGAFGRPQPYAAGGCWPGAVPGLPTAKGARQSMAGMAAPALGVGAAGPRVTGTMTKDHGSFGFISLDSGGPDMFVMPAACAEFGGVLPALHTRLEFEVTTDAKTGRPRAEGVVPLTS